MSLKAWVHSISSTLYRLAVYFFLRLIPVRVAKIVLPCLFTLYVVTFPRDWKGRSPSKAPEQNGHAKTAEGKESPSPPTPVPTPDSRSNLSQITSFALTLPSQSKRASRLALALNTLLLLFSLDLALNPYLFPAADVTYARVGAIYDDAVKIAVRYPKSNASEHVVRVVYRMATDNNTLGEQWKDGPALHLAESADWTNVTKLTSLWPNSHYEYRLVEATSSAIFLPYPSEPLRFKTFPDPRLQAGSHFRFLASSCAMPNFPYSPFRGGQIRGFDLLADYIWPMDKVDVLGPLRDVYADATAVVAAAVANVTTPQTASNESSADSTNASTPAAPALSKSPPMEFMLFLGDFIYADVPFYFGDNHESYRRLYRRNYASPSFRKVYERLPIFHIYDDHEIKNNYIGYSNDSSPPFPRAASAFEAYNSLANYDPIEPGQYYYDFRYSDTAFFVMDTRRYRTDNDVVDASEQTMLGDKQLAAFHTWLHKVNQTATFKFVITSVPFTTLWQHDAQRDSWAAYAAERASIMSALHSVPNVVVLSGDRHEFAAVEFTGPYTHEHTVLEFSTSPLSMFYVPFVRTLKMQSEAHVPRVTVAKETLENGTVVTHEDVEMVPEERVVKYIAKGNYKWSAFEVDTRDRSRPVVRVEVMIDGKLGYQVEIQGAPVSLRSSTALGAIIPQGIKNVLDTFGFRSTRWL